MMNKKPEIIPADKSKKLDFYLFIAVYCLLLIFIEPVINYLLTLNVSSTDIAMINKVNDKKIVLSQIAYGLLRMIPIFWLAWLGYRIVSSARLPPARMTLPFAVPCLQGHAAKKTGLIIIAIASLIMAQNIVFTIKQLAT